MLFNSHQFILIFLPVVVAGYFVCRRWHGAATVWLVASSLFFYSWWNPVFLWLILLSMTVNFALGRRLEINQSLAILWLGVAFNLGLLGYFKYTDFLIGVFNEATASSLPLQNIILPLAISFFTFQQIAYLVDSRRRLTITHGPLDYALFVSFFPQLIAGPIVHQAEMLPQLRESSRQVNPRLMAEGLALFSIGLVKKVLIADNIAPFSTQVFDAALVPGTSIGFFEAWMGALAYTFQIYFDFSGYCDMALGAARLFGIRLPINFGSPYKATGIIEFWRRWHMTLSRFLRDYLYIPIGGNRRSKWRVAANILIVMLLGGLWHGAAWNFVIWGALHGSYLLINRAFRSLIESIGFAAISASPLARVAGWLLTFIAVVVAWVFFRAESIPAGLSMLHGMIGLNGFALGLNHLSYLGSLAPLAEQIGVTFQSETLFSLRSVPWTVAGLAICLLFPNSQDWVARGAPVMRITWLQWKPDFFWGLALGLAAFVAVGFLARPSEFLYFNF